MPVIGSLVSALPILRVSRIVACCLLTRVRNATLGLLHLTFTDDGDCRFYLEAESIDMAVELDEYREFLTILSNEIEELRQQIDAVE